MWRCLACVGIIAGLAATPARAQEAVAQFYKGRQITVLVGSSAGGGYDIYARLLSRHMPKHIPRQSRHGGDEHGGRRQQRGGRAPVQRRAAGRRGDRRAAKQRRARRDSSISARRPSIIMCASPAPTRW
jgi:hypothetical protein